MNMRRIARLGIVAIVGLAGFISPAAAAPLTGQELVVKSWSQMIGDDVAPGQFIMLLGEPAANGTREVQLVQRVRGAWQGSWVGWWHPESSAVLPSVIAPTAAQATAIADASPSTLWQGAQSAVETGTLVFNQTQFVRIATIVRTSIRLSVDWPSYNWGPAGPPGPIPPSPGSIAVMTIDRFHEDLAAAQQRATTLQTIWDRPGGARTVAPVITPGADMLRSAAIDPLPLWFWSIPSWWTPFYDIAKDVERAKDEEYTTADTTQACINRARRYLNLCDQMCATASNAPPSCSQCCFNLGGGSENDCRLSNGTIVPEWNPFTACYQASGQN